MNALQAEAMETKLLITGRPFLDLRKAWKIREAGKSVLSAYQTLSSAQVASRNSGQHGVPSAHNVSKPFVGSSFRQLQPNERWLPTAMRNLRVLLTRNIINRKF